MGFLHIFSILNQYIVKFLTNFICSVGKKEEIITIEKNDWKNKNFFFMTNWFLVSFVKWRFLCPSINHLRSFPSTLILKFHYTHLCTTCMYTHTYYYAKVIFSSYFFPVFSQFLDSRTVKDTRYFRFSFLCSINKFTNVKYALDVGKKIVLNMLALL